MSIRKRNKPIGSHINKNNTVVNNQIKRDVIINNNNKENIDDNNNIITDNKNKRKLSFEEVGGVVSTKRQMLSDMLNGYRTEQRSSGASGSGDHHVQESPVATLSNMGNTCWLNSVLYTLRFAPTFLHNLHHLIGDLRLINQRLNQNKIKTSSLGRNIGTITGTSSSSSRSTSSKDLLSLTTTTSDNNVIKSKYQIVTEKLHELYCVMHQIEMKETNEPYQPDALLQAIRDANSIFDGNHQQDAHELLVYLLDNLRETCDLLQQQVQHNPDLLNDNNDTATTTTTSLINSKLWNVSRSKKKVQKKKDKNVKDVINEEQQQNIPDADDTCSVDSNNSENQQQQQQQRNNKRIYNFVVEDFQGITLRRTKCLECEAITERKEPFYDIPVPIPIKDDDVVDNNDNDFDLITANTSDIFRKACVLSEKLNDTNKYLCEQCTHYNEAVHDVLFEKLPNIMVLQLKRFQTTVNGVKKVTTYLPTPLQMDCFCETCYKCVKIQQSPPPHHYQLYCVIMHLGGTMASGHYISYIKASDHLNDYLDCTRNLQQKNCLSSSSSEKSLNFLKYFKPKQFTNTLIDSSRNLASSSSTNKTITNGVRICKSIDCCGIKLNRNIIENTINSFNRATTTTTNNDMWLECDDENVRPITTREFQEELSFKPNSTSTPYLLFYSKITETKTTTTTTTTID